MSGSIRSSTTMSGANTSASRTASAPLPAVTACQPSYLATVATNSAMCGSSSTTSSRTRLSLLIGSIVRQSGTVGETVPGPTAIRQVGDSSGTVSPDRLEQVTGIPQRTAAGTGLAIVLGANAVVVLALFVAAGTSAKAPFTLC